jgi:hypothetical protein
MFSTHFDKETPVDYRKLSKYIKMCLFYLWNRMEFTVIKILVMLGVP